MAGIESTSREEALEEARNAARVLRDRARALAQIDPGSFEILVELVVSQLNEIRATSTGARRDPSVLDGSPSPSPQPRRTISATDKPPTIRRWNKVRKSLAVEYLILLCLAQHDDGPVIVDQIVEFISRVFAIDDDGGRASLIAKLSRLKKDKGCLDDDDDLKGVGYKISQSGRDYLSKLRSVYLTKAELTDIEEKIKA